MAAIFTFSKSSNERLAKVGVHVWIDQAGRVDVRAEAGIVALYMYIHVFTFVA
jgi:hypothetical protein